MIMDKENLFSDAQAIAGAAGTYVSTNRIDLKAGLTGGGGTGGFITDSMGNTLVNEPGRSPKAHLEIQVTEAFVGGDSVNFQVVTDDDSAGGSPVVHSTTGAIAIAALKPGYKVNLALPNQHVVANRYLGVQYVTLGAGAMSAGKVTAGIVVDGQTANTL